MEPFHPSFRGKKIREILEEYGIEPDEKQGQVFLTNWKILEKEASYADLSPDDTVIEIGPGIGNLTEFLAKEAGNVIAIEKDEKFSAPLEEVMKEYGNLEVIYGDALEVEFPAASKVVSNLPYHISLPLVFKILETEVNEAILMIQQDQAEKLAASLGEKGYSRISVQVQRKCDPRFIRQIPKNAFYPAPDVDSAIIKLGNIGRKFEAPEEPVFKKILQYLFAFRDQKLEQALESLVISEEFFSNEQIINLGERKVENLSPEELGKISVKISEDLENPVKEIEKFFERENLYQQ